MSKYTDIGVEKHGHVGLIEIRKPPLNFFDVSLINQIADALEEFDRDIEIRASVLAALQSVDGVCIFTDTTATKFLAAAQPDIYVKGGDYTLETLNQHERDAVESAGGKIILVPLVPGKSTTSLLKKISRL